jgi:hypothetical protein
MIWGLIPALFLKQYRLRNFFEILLVPPTGGSKVHSITQLMGHLNGLEEAQMCKKTANLNQICRLLC